VALSSDASTALIGGPEDNGGVGAGWVFTRSGPNWSQQGAKLTAKGGEEIGTGPIGEWNAGSFGESVALSSDGHTALIGHPDDNNKVGAVWVFTRSGSTWTQQGPKLTASDEASNRVPGPHGSTTVLGGGFGCSVALSSDGDTALIGGFRDNNRAGAAWIFTRSGAVWTQQGKKLSDTEQEKVAEFGFSVALSASGNTALLGSGQYSNEDYGAAWVFRPVGSAWTQDEKLTDSEHLAFAELGQSVALSSDGGTALVGAPNSGDPEGKEVWVFANPQPTVDEVSPHKGLAAGGATVTISGTNLADATAVHFGSVSAPSFTANSDSSVTAESPAETAGRVDVTVTTPNGPSAISPNDHFKFGPPTVTNLSPHGGLRAGGTSVTVTGTGFGLGAVALASPSGQRARRRLIAPRLRHARSWLRRTNMALWTCARA
jgi:hypothetical protein